VNTCSSDNANADGNEVAKLRLDELQIGDRVALHDWSDGAPAEVVALDASRGKALVRVYDGERGLLSQRWLRAAALRRTTNNNNNNSQRHMRATSTAVAVGGGETIASSAAAASSAAGGGGTDGAEPVRRGDIVVAEWDWVGVAPTDLVRSIRFCCLLWALLDF
jgi:hypothetical protein